MVREPIVNPKGYYEGLSYVKPPVTLEKEDVICFPDCLVWFDKFWILDEEKPMTISEFEKNFKEKIECHDCIEIEFESAFHDETYEYNKEDGKWYLVDRGKGYA